MVVKDSSSCGAMHRSRDRDVSDAAVVVRSPSRHTAPSPTAVLLQDSDLARSI
jgi:hypothetical protein